MFRFLLKFQDPVRLVRNTNPKSACLFNRNRNRRHRNVCVVGFMKVQHYLIIHLVDVVTAKDQNIVRIVIFHIP